MKRLLTILMLVLPAVVASVAQNPSASILGKTDIQALLEAVPGLPSSMAEAVKRAYGPEVRNFNAQSNLEVAYRPFFEQAASAHARLNQAINSRRKDMPDQATVLQQAKDQINASPIIAGMGGVDKIQGMTPEQREQAARQAVAAYQQKLVTKAGGNSTGMQALMQKVMSDPEYRARFQQMSQQEKEAEVRKYTGAAPTVNPGRAGESSPALPANNELATAMAVRNDLLKMLARRREIDADFTKQDQAITATKDSHKEIELEIWAKIEQVPMVVLGEAGHDRDPKKMAVLNEERCTRHHDRAKWELEQRAAIYNQRKTRYKELATEYQSWLKQNLGRINTSLATPLRNTNTELEAAGFEDGLIALSEDLARYSKQVTADAAEYEAMYQDRLLHRAR